MAIILRIMAKIQGIMAKIFHAIAYLISSDIIEVIIKYTKN